MATEKPKAPRRNCKNAARWRDYYAKMAAWHQEAVDTFEKSYPNAAEMARNDAKRFQSGVEEIDNRTHPNILSGVWK